MDKLFTKLQSSVGLYRGIGVNKEIIAEREYCKGTDSLNYSYIYSTEIANIPITLKVEVVEYDMEGELCNLCLNVHNKGFEKLGRTCKLDTLLSPRFVEDKITKNLEKKGLYSKILKALVSNTSKNYSTERLADNFGIRRKYIRLKGVECSNWEDVSIVFGTTKHATLSTLQIQLHDTPEVETTNLEVKHVGVHNEFINHTMAKTYIGTSYTNRDTKKLHELLNILYPKTQTINK